MENSFDPVTLEVEYKKNQALNFVFQRLHNKEALLRQKSHFRWLREGDLNSRLFHSSKKSRFRINGLLAMI